MRTEILYPSDYTELLTGKLEAYGLKNVKVPLTYYAGKKIHIAFRHWDCTDQDRLILSNIEAIQELSISEVKDITKPLVAWVENDLIYVYGLKTGDSVEIFSILESLIYQNKAQSEIERIKLNSRGVYIVKSGSRVMKVVY